MRTKKRNSSTRSGAGMTCRARTRSCESLLPLPLSRVPRHRPHPSARPPDAPARCADAPRSGLRGRRLMGGAGAGARADSGAGAGAAGAEGHGCTPQGPVPLPLFLLVSRTLPLFLLVSRTLPLFLLVSRTLPFFLLVSRTHIIFLCEGHPLSPNHCHNRFLVRYRNTSPLSVPRTLSGAEDGAGRR